MSYYGTVAWEGYLVQPAGGIIRLADTHCGLEVTGAGIVAVIDSGVDPGHPTLQPVLTQGWDFTRDVAGGDEMADLGQASVAVRDGAYRVNQSSVAVLDQASVALLDDQAHVAFGHGTMVAGIVHLAAPTAQIMPLKAFHADGQGYTSDILRAIYYATWKGAKILNMSFSSPTSSPEIGRALYYATSQGLVSVASVGNDGSASLVYPAAFGKVMGVASTSNDGTRSSFSNYGAAQVWVAAPGEGIITTYPWSSYAAGWGTSFSTPFVSGAAALLVGMEGTADYDQVSQAVSHANPLTSDLGYGRLDLYQAVLAGRALWPGAPPSPVPGTCSSLGVDWSPAP
jgi:subtilisin family serine protease